MAPPTTIFPVEERELYIVREATPGTIPASVGVPVPFTSLKPSNKPVWLKDESMQGSMGDYYALIQGPLTGTTIDVGSNFFGDVIGHFLLNVLGDYTTTGTAASPAGTTNASMAVGATAISVASGGASFTTGMNLWLEDAGSPAANEVVQVTATGSATSIPITATRFAHATAMPFTNTSAPYTHVFAVLNGLVGAPNGAAQPWTHAITDRTGIPATGLADQYAYCCLSELAFTANAEKLVGWTAKIACYTRQVPGSGVNTSLTSTVQTYPGWRTVFGVGGVASGGTQRKEVGEIGITITRSVKPIPTLQGAQYPYVIGRGKAGVTGKLSVTPAIDDSYLAAMLANTQPQLQVISSNGLTGANLVSIQADIGFGAYETADINDSSDLFGWDVAFSAPHTAATITGATGNNLTGASGGKSAIKITLINAVPSY